MDKINAVNLLPTATRLNITQQKLAKRLRNLSILTGIVSILFVLGVFGYEFWLIRQKKSLLTEKKGLEESILQFSPRLILQQKLRFRLKLVSKLLASRTETTERLVDLSNILPEGTLVEDINIEKNEIEIKGRFARLSQVEAFEEKVTAVKNQEIYQEISFSSLHKTAIGWPFSLTLVEK